MEPAKLSPDCRDGNCSKCDGNAWDMLRDKLTACECKHHQDHGTTTDPAEQALDPGPPWKLLGTTTSGFRVFTAPAHTELPNGPATVTNDTGRPEYISPPPRISDR